MKNAVLRNDSDFLLWKRDRCIQLRRYNTYDWLQQYLSTKKWKQPVSYPCWIVWNYPDRGCEIVLDYMTMVYKKQ